jgi:uncharacterized delta-60 repeat protein
MKFIHFCIIYLFFSTCKSQSLDLSFGIFGLVYASYTPITGTGESFHESSTIQFDNKIIVAARSTGTLPKFVVARFNPNGSFDTTFSNTGIRLITFNPNVGTQQKVTNVAMQMQNNKILISGYTTTNGALRRLNSDGIIDSTFGVNGIKTFNVSSNNVTNIQRIVPLTNGQFLTIAYINASTNKDVVVTRFNINGDIDSSYASNGSLVISSLPFDDFPSDAKIINNGDLIILVSSNTTSSPTSVKQLSLLRINSNGVIDTTFANNGILNFSIANKTIAARKIDIDNTGNIYCALYYSANNLTNDMAMIKTDSNGILDTNFGVNGLVTTDFGGGSDVAFDIKVTTNNIYLVGSAYDAIMLSNLRSHAMAKYTLSGQLDVNFYGTGKKVFFTSHYLSSSYDLYVDSSGNFIMVGNSMTSGFGLSNTSLIKLSNSNSSHLTNGSIINFSYHPNPTSDILRFNSDLNSKQISLFNTLGILIKTCTISDGQIDIKEIPAGVYFLKLKDGPSNFLKLIKE